MPYITFYSGSNKYNQYTYDNTIEFYNIFRDIPTTVHSKSQRKISSNILIDRKFIKYGTRINYSSNIYNQIFNVEDKKINNISVSNNYFRTFPIFGINLETPFRLIKNYGNLVYTPKLSFVVSPGASNTNKISNEDSSVNSYTIDNNSNLNRFTGSDKMDNSKRINLGFEISNEKISANLLQSYEFTNNSNFHYSQGNEKKLSDLLGDLSYSEKNYNTSYAFRYDVHDEFVKSQNLNLNIENRFSFIELKYLDQKSKTDEIIISDNETLNYKIDTKKINKFSKISYFGLYDVKNTFNKESGLKYSYFDECFGLNIDFKRNSYADNDLKPQDSITIMLSFKNIGSYKSTNLAVSEEDKQDIEWENMSIDNELFE